MMDMVPKRFGQIVMALVFAYGFFPPENYVIMGVGLIGFAFFTCVPTYKQ